VWARASALPSPFPFQIAVILAWFCVVRRLCPERPEEGGFRVREESLQESIALFPKCVWFLFHSLNGEDFPHNRIFGVVIGFEHLFAHGFREGCFPVLPFGLPDSTEVGIPFFLPDLFRLLRSLFFVPSMEPACFLPKLCEIIAPPQFRPFYYICIYIYIYICVCVCVLRLVEPKARPPRGIGRPAACLTYLY
jgi:hypothetical protein